MRSILAKFLSLLLLVVGCSGGEVDFARSLAVPQPADLVLRHGKIITVDKEFSINEAVAIKGGRFIVVGSDRDVRPTMGPTTRGIDFGGGPGLSRLIDFAIYGAVGGLEW